ncbi:MAG TPA: hypothetical protein VF755_25450 [Catenuloplanes sp.]|jgi:hypothetical protein
MVDHTASIPGDPATTGPDPRDEEELGRTRDAQQAHGGSMAPSVVDETGHPVGDAAATEPDGS